MKKILIYAVGALLFTACTSNSSEKNEEVTPASAESVSPAIEIEADTANNEALPQPVVNEEKEAESFYKSLPNIKKLAIADHKKESKYLHSLGFKGSFREKGVEEDWQAEGTFTLDKGQSKCVVKAHVDGYYQYYDITITGDDEARNRYFKETKKVTRTKYDSPINTKMKGNTIAIEVQDY